MALRIAIIGPGRVGTAFARQFLRAGANVFGLLGRNRSRTLARVRELGLDEQRGALGWQDLESAHVVIFAVGDSELQQVIAEAAAAGGRRCSLWLHTSGRHDLDVFAPAAPRAVRIGSLHPLLPFAATQAGNALAGDAMAGNAMAGNTMSGNAMSGNTISGNTMAGAPALLVGEPRSVRLLQRLCRLLELQPIVCSGHDRVLYHAACALAANGATALFETASDLLQRAGGLGLQDTNRIVAALMRAAVAGSFEHGPGPALSGPVRRGDAATVAAHVAALQQQTPAALPTYLALMQQALELARAQGLPANDCERVAAALSWRHPAS